MGLLPNVCCRLYHDPGQSPISSARAARLLAAYEARHKAEEAIVAAQAALAAQAPTRPKSPGAKGHGHFLTHAVRIAKGREGASLSSPGGTEAMLRAAAAFKDGGFGSASGLGVGLGLAGVSNSSPGRVGRGPSSPGTELGRPKSRDGRFQGVKKFGVGAGGLFGRSKVHAGASPNRGDHHIRSVGRSKQQQQQRDLFADTDGVDEVHRRNSLDFQDSLDLPGVDPQGHKTPTAASGVGVGVHKGFPEATKASPDGFRAQSSQIPSRGASSAAAHLPANMYGAAAAGTGSLDRQAYSPQRHMGRCSLSPSRRTSSNTSTVVGFAPGAVEVSTLFSTGRTSSGALANTSCGGASAVIVQPHLPPFAVGSSNSSRRQSCSSTGVPVQKLIEQVRARSSQTGDADGEGAAAGLPLDEMLRVYNALNKNRSSPDRAAALNQLLYRASQSGDAGVVGWTEGIPEEEEEEWEESGEVRAHPLDTIGSTLTDAVHSAMLSGLHDSLQSKGRSESKAPGLNGIPDQQSDKEKMASWHEEEAEDREEVLRESGRKSEAPGAAARDVDKAGAPAAAGSSTDCSQQQQDEREQGQDGLGRPEAHLDATGPEGYVVVSAFSSQHGGDQDLSGKSKNLEQVPGTRGNKVAALSRKQLQKLLHKKQSEMLLVKDTTTGQAALGALGAQMTAELTIAGAVELLKKGLVQGCATASSGTVAASGATGESAAATSAGEASSPEASGRSSKGSEGGSSSGGKQQRQQQHSYRAKCCIGGYSKGDLEVFQGGCSSGGSGGKGTVKFELDQKTHKLLMWKEVVDEGSSSSNACKQQAVVGVRLPEGKWTAGSSVGLVMANGQVHPMELVGQRDWGGLLVGLNAMLLLAETAEEGVAEHGKEGVEEVLSMLGEQRVQDMPWSAAVMGLEV